MSRSSSYNNMGKTSIPFYSESLHFGEFSPVYRVFTLSNLRLGPVTEIQEVTRETGVPEEETLYSVRVEGKIFYRSFRDRKKI